MTRLRFQQIRLSGWRAVLAGVVALLAAAVVAMLSLVALAFGVLVSVSALLAHRVRALLRGGGSPAPIVRHESAPQDARQLEAREIRVDEVIVDHEPR